MKRACAPRMFLSAVLLLTLSLCAAPARAQSGSSPAPANPRVYDASKETVISGTIASVTTKAKPGLPLGLHVMLSTAQGQMDVQLGPYFARIAAKEGVVAGATIQVTGVASHFNAGDVFLARTVTVGGKTITVRNKNGFPARPGASGARVVGGAQPAGGL